MVNICILGATSHIAKGLIWHFDLFKYNLYLFSRNNPAHRKYTEFFSYKYDVIINCIGLGTYKEDFDYSNYFTVTEYYDNMIIKYLQQNKKCKYINISTGAIHKNFSIDSLQDEDIQTVTRINSEAKHRTFKDLSIIDLRLYSYFSRWANIYKDNYLMNSIIKALIINDYFITTNNDFVRDFVHPEDLFNIIIKCIQCKNVNCAFEIKSKNPTTKDKIVNYFKDNYDLKVKIKENISFKSLTGNKEDYYSKARTNIFDVKYSSMEAIAMESKYFEGQFGKTNN